MAKRREEREKEGRTNIAVAAKNAQLFLSRGYVPRKILQRAFVRKKLNVPCTRRYRELDDAAPRGKSLARVYFWSSRWNSLQLVHTHVYTSNPPPPSYLSSFQNRELVIRVSDGCEKPASFRTEIVNPRSSDPPFRPWLSSLRRKRGTTESQSNCLFSTIVESRIFFLSFLFSFFFFAIGGIIRF